MLFLSMLSDISFDIITLFTFGYDKTVPILFTDKKIRP